MPQPMPLSNFDWVDQEELQKIAWLAQTSEQPTGYFVKVALEYPPELHVLHNVYPLAHEGRQVRSEYLS